MHTTINFEEKTVSYAGVAVSIERESREATPALNLVWTIAQQYDEAVEDVNEGVRTVRAKSAALSQSMDGLTVSIIAKAAVDLEKAYESTRLLGRLLDGAIRQATYAGADYASACTECGSIVTGGGNSGLCMGCYLRQS